MTDVVAISGGVTHTLAVRADGTVWGWGSNLEGQLGDGTTTSRLTPVQATGLSGIVSVAAGSSHSLALDENGDVWVWGRNLEAQLARSPATAFLNTPTRVTGLSEVVAISAGATYSHVIVSTEPEDEGQDPVLTVWGWGQNGFGAVGDTNSGGLRESPVQVISRPDVVGISASIIRTLLLLADGTVQGWGSNGSGELGNGPGPIIWTPQPVPGFSNAVGIAAGGSHTAVLHRDGTVTSQGANWAGQLGDGSTDNRETPVRAQGLQSIVSIAAGAGFTVALDEDGRVWAWGHNANGQIGDGSTLNRSAPARVTGLPGGAE